MSLAFPFLNNTLLGSNAKSVALVAGEKSFCYSEVNQAINSLAYGLLGEQSDLQEERIAFVIPASVDYVSCLFGIWRAGGIAVPLSVGAALPELKHALSTARVTRVIAAKEQHDDLKELCDSLQIELLIPSQLAPAQLNVSEEKALPEIQLQRRAMILFTSGTTNKPKGVVSTHQNIHAQVSTLIEAWAWQEGDSIPLFLPLHHVHGIINVLCCGLWAGASVHLFPRFDSGKILQQVAEKRFTVFMAVPTIYVKLIQILEESDENIRQTICDGFAAMRLNVSGSAACPVKVYQQWLSLTGQTLLERYGMTEIGMAISNPYTGERRAGSVGLPLPGVDIILVDEEKNVVSEEDCPGEIRIKGDSVFLEYWDNADASAASFVDGWFCSGDIAVLEQGYYRIMGRSSVDIIKSGGYKISALEIEGTLLNHEAIAQCAVIGVADDTWGEKVFAFLVLKPEQDLHYEDFKSWCKLHMSSYKIPAQIKMLDSLPRNAMGKVTKPALKELL